MLEREPAQIQDQFMRPLGSNRTRSAIFPSESLLAIQLRPGFSVVLEGYAGGA